MTETITAREANQNFSRLLRDVAAGQEYIITRNGTPVAKLAPVAAQPGKRVLTAEQQEALDRLIQTALTHKVPDDAEPAHFDRDELYLERFKKFDRQA